MFLGDTVTKKCTRPRNLTWFTRLFLLMRDEDETTGYHVDYYICVYVNIHIYLFEEPNSDHYFYL